jgi:Protein of unknown function (DUF3829)
MRTAVGNTAWLFPVCFFACFGCKKIMDEAVQAQKVGTEGGGSLTGEELRLADEDQALGEKLNGYIRDCLNRFSKPVRSSEERYYSWTDPQKGPTGKERRIDGVDEIAMDPDQCRASIIRSNARLPKHPEMESKADAYAAALLVVVPVVNQAHQYYERGEQRTDKMVKAKQLHPRLIAAFDAFDKADNELSQVVDQVQEGLDRRELVRIEKQEGRRGHWYTVETTLLAKPLLHESAKEPSKIDLAAVTAASDEFDRALDAFDAWASRSPADSGKSANFLSAAKELSAAGKSLVQRQRDKRAFSGAEKKRMGTSSGATVEGSPDAVLDKYNRLVEAYNLVRY